MKKPDKIKKGLECCNHEYVDCHNCPYNEEGEGWACVVERNADALAYIQQLEAAQPKWISVEERLPGNCVEVLLYYKKGYVSMGYWDDDLCEWDGMTDEKIVRPDYWMSLPEPPKEG